MKNKNSKIWLLVLCSVFLVVAVITKGFGLFEGEGTSPVLDRGAVITISLSEVSENAKWYEYKGSRFFAVKAADRTIKTALDACDVCYAAGKGYRQEGNYMVCNNCGNRYPISGLGTENKNPGGCWPSYLPNTVNEDNVVIKKSDLVLRNGAQGGTEEECDLETGVCPVF